ncbi:MAG TPA: hypothetical protein VK020_01185 [Microlunatus sp.]|nr:hypothetical protein [Microlunatus sp.]
MRFGVGVGGVLLGVLAVVGCTPQPVACTGIGSAPGIGVTIEEDTAGGVTGLDLTVCFEDSCRDVEVTLTPGSDTVDEGCDSDDADSPCGARAVPNGTLVGFADVEGLPAGPVDVRGELIKDDAKQPLDQVTVMAAVTHPNGPACPAGANQARITIGPKGIR